MALSHWTTTTIEPFGCDVIIKNLNAAQGKFYAGSKQKDSATWAGYNDRVVLHDTSYTIHACGSSDSGSEGLFDIFDITHLSEPLATYYWNNPNDAKHNIAFLDPHADSYLMKLTGGNLYDGALGNITIKVTRFPI